mmetsp:Transcript_1116/g.3427  ORF Transcript_1116/g.3427 Transcript_1116/m.3427 type:complete len:201 (-) Transcript_1116:110-712(-)
MLLGAIQECCCQDCAEGYQEVFNGRGEKEVQPTGILVLGKPLPPPKTPPLTLPSNRSDVSAAPSTQERREERSRLQQLVRDFAHAAVQGRSCHLLDPETGAFDAAVYRVDKRLRQLYVDAEFANRRISLDLVDIEDIFTVEDGEKYFPPNLLAALGQEDRCRLLTLHGAERLYLLEITPGAKENFHTCMKILRLYALQQK